MNARRAALLALRDNDPARKAAQTRAIATAPGRVIVPGDSIETPPGLPGRPALPRLLPALKVPARSAFTPEGRAALLHAIAHIEFNAINLALDAVWRFAGLPEAFYRDWLQVAAEEALHFELVRAHLQSCGYDYGDFDAHDGLWTMAERTAGDVLARVALVPRTLEARGLDATPPLIAKFSRAGDLRAAEILGVILRDEVGHVAIGNRWYRWLCQRDGVDAEAHYAVLAARHQAPRPRPPFNLQARRDAGFTEAELLALERLPTATGSPW
ncbi:MAG: ferritin-like domain-containing protein [Caldimonas sp.]